MLCYMTEQQTTTWLNNRTKSITLYWSVIIKSDLLSKFTRGKKTPGSFHILKQVIFAFSRLLCIWWIFALTLSNYQVFQIVRIHSVYYWHILFPVNAPYCTTGRHASSTLFQQNWWRGTHVIINRDKESLLWQLYKQLCQLSCGRRMADCRRCADPKFNFYRHVWNLIPCDR